MALKLVKAENQNKSSILKGLNEKQIEAVSIIDGPLLVVAGAGSGKTRVLTYRIAYLLERGISPYNILALTFTNKAANEMKERIAKIVAGDAAGKIWAGTFHSVFARILRIEAEKLGFTKSFSIYDTDDSLSAIRHISGSMGISLQQFPAQGFHSRISWAKNQMISWQNYSQTADSPIEKQTALVYEAYSNHLRTSNAMDFDDLLINMIHLLQNEPDILEKYQNRFKYILVDEYQDTNRTQYTVVNLLARKHKNLCVVGDDAQSIYRWRGADIRNILDFQKDYQAAKVVPLEQNYRSTKNIIEAAGSVIKLNRRQIPKTLWTDNHEGELLDLLPCYDDREEAEKVVNIVKNKIADDGLKPQDFAVLYRTNAQSLAFENAFRKVNIPYIIIGGMSFYKRKEVKDTLAYLRLLVNSQDAESLTRIVNEPPRGIGLTSIKHIRAFAGEQGVSLFEAFARAGENNNLQNRAINAADTFSDFIKKYSDMRENTPPDELVLQYIEATGLLQMYKEINTEDALDRWNNIQQLLSDIERFFRENEEAELDDYLQQISLVADIDEKDTTQNQVKLMTLHAAKGLEFPVVFITGLEHGLFPLAKAELHPDEEEEERRLFYVGITRAEQKLYLSYANRRMRFGEFSDQAPSQFLGEIDERYINKFNVENRTNKKTVQRVYEKTHFFDDIPKKESYSQIPHEQPEPALNFRAGDKVKHNTFGNGKIEVISGTGQNIKAVVRFQDAGRKVLMLQYAKLSKV
ncbi:MAG: ATP-dependent helicase UvrD/PcrA [Bacteroidota bacterium]|nr:ATP-dependent helicase UvrD/PcrA [Bacteroidota bacterium]